LIKHQLSHNDIKESCGNQSYARGQKYAAEGRVTSIKIQQNDADFLRFYAVSRGSGSRSYKLDVHIDAFEGEIEIDGNCSCPVGYNCKHVAASCLVFLGDNQKPSAIPSAKHKQRLVHDWMDKVHTAASANEIYLPSGEQEFLVYVLRAKVDSRVLSTIDVDMIATRPRKNGKGLTKGKIVFPENLVYEYNYRQWDVQPVDHEIAGFLKVLKDYRYYNQSITLDSRASALAIQAMLDTNRCCWLDPENGWLSPGEIRSLQIEWILGDNQEYSLNLEISPNALILLTEPPMYLDTAAQELGLIDANGVSSALLSTLANTPAVPEALARDVSLALIQNFPNLDLPTPQVLSMRENKGELLRPWVTLTQQHFNGRSPHFLSLEFDYDGDRIKPVPLDDVSILSNKNEMVRIQRNPVREQEILERVQVLGFAFVEELTQSNAGAMFVAFGHSINESADIWARFIEQDITTLRSEGWHIEIDDSFQLEFLEGDWEGLIEDQEDDDENNINGWFDLRFDLMVDGQKLPLAPLIAPILELDPDTLPETLTLEMEDHRYLRLPSERLRPFLGTLRELFNRAPPDKDGNIRLSRFDATLIDDLEDDRNRIKGAKKLRELAAKLRDFSGIQDVALPIGLRAELRDYQKKGVNWLQFLREYHFNGILADDMGLGKTVQTLAHLLIEKESGRMEYPALVIAPTSLMGNWRREAEHFTPGLRVIVLHGNNRHALFDSISQNDLVLTTYPLLARDTEFLLSQKYHYVVLDEAQAIKNPKTKMAKTVRDFKANHRLCLTGTPLENHLGELWSLYDFLMPGFLDNYTKFTRYYRTPIEKNGDSERKESLVRRIQPFLLRREKTEVASELPPKTEIIHNIELGRDQAQLYESIRVSMDKRVRDAIKSQGLARSHITILDALLKLRQICCDPRLAKLEQAQSVKHSAKLEWLMEMLPEQLEEGRRILLFSQFTSMLGLIEIELQKRNIEYTKLTGQTRKRDEAIQRFREGEVNLFLISLKAGGTGLNLTEADTVIIYDPWWNPAVELQAVDRAHRIGQNKPVFIYKLVTTNSVEEKMLVMQERKQALAKGIYDKAPGQSEALIDANSLKDLFAPLN
jgi:superfamily II DNA or RNA helicase